MRRGTTIVRRGRKYGRVDDRQSLRRVRWVSGSMGGSFMLVAYENTGTSDMQFYHPEHQLPVLSFTPKVGLTLGDG